MKCIIFRYKSNGNWAAVYSIKCNENKQAELTLEAKISDIVPDHIRCMKESELEKRVCIIEMYILRAL